MSYQNYTDTLQGVRKGAGYLAKVREKFPHAMLEEEWQTANQVTITVKTEMLPEVVEFLYYGCGGWLPVLWGNDERPSKWAVCSVLCAVDGRGGKMLGDGESVCQPNHSRVPICNATGACGCVG